MDSKTGSALVLALIFTIVLSIAVSAYLKLSLVEMRMSHDTFYRGAAFNLAEAGLEEALFAFNNSDWTSWSNKSGDNNYYRSFDYTSEFAQGVKDSSVQVIVIDGNLPTPKILSLATVESADGKTRSKCLYVEMTSAISPYLGVGFVTKGDGDYSNVTITNASGQEVFVGSVEGELNVAQAEIYGSIGFNSTNGSIRTHNKTVVTNNATTYDGTGDVEFAYNGIDLMDATAVDENFSANLLPVSAPDTTGYTDLSTASLTTVVTRAGGKQTISTIIPAGNYYVDGYALPNNMQIGGDVTIVVKGELNIGNNTLYVPTNSNNNKLKLFVAGDIKTNGQGSIETDAGSEPAQLQIYGTSTTSQEFDFNGSNNLDAVVYAPNADIDLNGTNTAVTGAVVANTLDSNGVKSMTFKAPDQNLLYNGGGTAIGVWRERYEASEQYDVDGAIFDNGVLDTDKLAALTDF